MTSTIMLRALAWRGANEECRRAATEWERLRDGCLAEVMPQLSPKERLHLRHTVFRINSLVCLYNTLCRRPHSTELGALLGAITHLLDHAYDHGHRRDVPLLLPEIEDVVYQAHAPDRREELQATLADLSMRAWRLVADPSTFTPWLRQMLSTQRRSTEQERPGRMAPDALEALTDDKGHHSLCLYFAAVNPDFSREEATALRSFGAYMQYMDDLEDLYEDRAEGRQSPVRGVLSGMARATGAFARAMAPMLRYYRHAQGGYSYRMFAAWLVLFHLGILLAVGVREVIRHLPESLQSAMDRSRERLAARFPFFYVVPLSAAQTRGATNA